MVRTIKVVQQMFKRDQLNSLNKQQRGGNIAQGENTFTRSVKYEIERLGDILRTKKRKGKQIMDQARSLKTMLENELKKDNYRPQDVSSKANESSMWRKENKFWTAKDPEYGINESTNNLKIIADLSAQNPTIDFTKQKNAEEKKLEKLMELRSELLRSQRIQEKQKAARAGYKDLSLYEKNLKAKLEKKVKRLEYKARYERIKIKQKDLAIKRLKKLKEDLKSKRKANEAHNKYKKWKNVATEAQDKIFEAKDKEELRKALLTSFAAQDGATSSTVDYVKNSMPNAAPGALLNTLRKEVNSVNKLYILDEPSKQTATAAPAPKQKTIAKPLPRLKRKREITIPPPSAAISVPVAYNTRSRTKPKTMPTQLKKRRRR